MMRFLNIFLAAILLLSLHFHPCKTSRALPEELHEGHRLPFQSLDRGTVPPSKGSGCTYIPGGGSSCSLVKEMNYAGDAVPYASAYPHPMVQFGVATNPK